MIDVTVWQIALFGLLMVALGYAAGAGAVTASKGRVSTTARQFGGTCACTQDDNCSCCVYFTEFDEFPQDADTSMADAFRGSWDDIHSVSLRSSYVDSLHYAFKSGWLERGKQRA